MSHLNAPQFKDADKARQYLEAIRWPNGPICPHCGSVSEDHYALQGKSHRVGLWKCKDCREQFSVTVGTVFERSKIKLNVWLQAVYLLCSSKKGISSHQLHRTLGLTYKTAWFMSHRIREAMKSDPTGPLGGTGKIVEADETYFGNRPGVKKYRGPGHKYPILSLVERNGAVRSFHVADVTAKNVWPVLLGQIDRKSHLMTDEAMRYRNIGKEFANHTSVNHEKKEYARGITSTNTIEGFFSILKRGLIGTYFHVSGNHLQRYCDEFDFRYTNRERREKIDGTWHKIGFDDQERTDIALQGIAGKRLTYRRTTSPQ